MSIIDVKVFNLLVHYDLAGSKNLVDLLEDGLLNKLVEEIVIDSPHTMYVYEVGLDKRKGKHFLSGYFYRADVLRWENVPGADGKHRSDPGSKAVLPCARFFLDLENHRLFWSTKRGITSSPTAFHFRTYIRTLMLSQLREQYTVDAERAWQVEKRQKGITKSKFIAQYLAEHNVTRKTFKIELIPEVSKDKIADILRNKNNILKRASFFPHLNNVTKDHLIALFTTVSELGQESQAASEVKMSPLDEKVGIKKEPIFKLLKHNEKKQILKFEFVIKDTSTPSVRPFTISNARTADMDQYIQKTEVIKEDFDTPDLLENILKKGEYVEDRGVGKKERLTIAAKIRKLLK